MLGDSITVTVNAVAKTLLKINQDSYGAEYLLREATGTYRMLIRHSTEKALVLGQKVERHNVQFERNVFGATADDPGNLTVISTTIRNPASADAVVVDQLSDALADFVKAQGVKLVGWES